MSSTPGKAACVRAVEHFLREQQVPADAAVLVALSGGPDSCALLDILCEARGRRVSRVGCAYFRHNLRDKAEGDAEARFVADRAASYGVAVHFGEAAAGELAAFADTHRRSLEDVARSYRYRFLRGVMDEHGYRFLAVGHSLTDHVETVIQRVFQGADWEGLRGIPAVRGDIIRPLRTVSRRDIMEYLNEKRLPYFVDSSNRDGRFLRNAIRIRLIPAVEEVFPGYERALAALAEKMSLLSKAAEGTAAPAHLFTWRADGLTAPMDAFLTLPPPARLRALYAACARLADASSGGFARIPFRFLRPFLTEEVTLPSDYDLRGHGVRIWVDGDRLALSAVVVFPRGFGYFIVVPALGETTTTRFPGNGGYVSVSVEAAPGNGARKAGTCEYGPEDEPVFVRSRRPGDGIVLPEGRKSLHKLFAEWRIPEADRCSIPVVDSRSGVLAVLGSAVGFRDRCSSKAIGGLGGLQLSIRVRRSEPMAWGEV